MKDAGYSHKNHTEMAMPSGGSTGANSKIYPSVNIDHKSMPHLKKHKVGDTGHMHIKYKVTQAHQYKSGEGDTSLEITHYEPAKKIKGKSDKDLEDAADKDEAGEGKEKE